MRASGTMVGAAGRVAALRRGLPAAGPARVDAAIGAALLVLFLVPDLDELVAQPPLVAVAGLVAGAGLAVAAALRTRAPLAALAVVSVALLTELVDLRHPPPPSDQSGLRWSLLGAAVLATCWSVTAAVTARSPVRMAVPALVAAGIVWAAALGLIDADPPDGGAVVWSVVESLSSVPVFFLPWVAPGGPRPPPAPRALPRAARLAEQAEARRALAVDTERALITRDLHELVTASLERMATTAARAHAHYDDRPADAEQALAAVESLGRDVLAAMRRMLGILRDPAGPAPAPAGRPTLAAALAALRALPDPVRPVELTEVGDPVPLPPAVDLAGSRIVQHAAAQGGPWWLTVAHEPGALRIRVTRPRDGGRAWRRAEMDAVRPWLELVDGRLRAGEHGDRRTLEARLPLP